MKKIIIENFIFMTTDPTQMRHNSMNFEYDLKNNNIISSLNNTPTHYRLNTLNNSKN